MNCYACLTDPSTRPCGTRSGRARQRPAIQRGGQVGENQFRRDSFGISSNPLEHTNQFEHTIKGGDEHDYNLTFLPDICNSIWL